MGKSRSKYPLAADTVVTTVDTRTASAWHAIAGWLLAWAERFYLHACGWTRVHDHPAELYVPPDDYPYRRHEWYERSHAINAQRMWNGQESFTQRRIRAQHRRAVRANRPRSERPEPIGSFIQAAEAGKITVMEVRFDRDGVWVRPDQGDD